MADCPLPNDTRTPEEMAIDTILDGVAAGVSSYTRPDGSTVTISNPVVALEATKEAIRLKAQLNCKMPRPLAINSID